jgi:hypothetical protein
MASQFNRALQQVDRQRVTLGSTGITSTDVKRWLQTLPQAGVLLDGALSTGLACRCWRRTSCSTWPRPSSSATARARRRRKPAAGPGRAGRPAERRGPAGRARRTRRAARQLAPGRRRAAPREVLEALLGPQPARTRYAQLAYKAQLLPLLGDPQARELPGSTGALARQPWRVQWQAATQAVAHEDIELLSQGRPSVNDDPHTSPWTTPPN